MNKVRLIFIYMQILFVSPLITVCGQSDALNLESGVRAYLDGDRRASLINYLDYLKTYPTINDQENHSLRLRVAYLAAWFGQTDISQSILLVADSLENKGIIPDSAAKSDRFMIRAIDEFYKSRFAEAVDLLHESLKFRQGGSEFEKAIKADTYSFLGLTYKLLKDYTTAIDYYETGIRIDRELKRSLVTADELRELAGTHIAIDPFDPNIEPELREALELYTSLGMTLRHAYVYNEYGILYQKRGNLKKALEYFLETVRIKEDEKEETNLDLTYNNIGAIYQEMNQTDSSIYYIRKAINTADKLKKEIKGEYYSNLAARYALQGRLDSAIFYFDKANRQIIEKSLPNDANANTYSVINPLLPGNIAGIATALYQSYEKTGNLKTLKTSIQTFDTALHQLDTLRFLYSFENKALAVKDNRNYYFMALQYATEYFKQTNDPADMEEVFRLASRSKAFVFDEYLRINEAREYIDIGENLIKRDDELKMRKAEILQRTIELNSVANPVADSTSKYKELKMETDEALRELNQEIKEKIPAYFQRINTMPTYSSDFVRSRLKENEILLDYTWHDQQLIIIVLGSDIMEIHRVLTPDTLRKTLGIYSDFLQGWKSPLNYTRFKSTSLGLYELLIAPFESLIMEKDIYIIPDDSLAILPFETLLFSQGSESGVDYASLPFLIKKNPISYFHSIQQFVLNSEQSSIESKGVSAFAPFNKTDYTDGTEYLNKLESSSAELKSIKKHLSTRTYLSKSATEKNFRKAIKKPRIIHIATHGLQKDSTPLQNHLLFYPQGDGSDYKFHLFELLGMQIESPLVVLSSCNTGAGTFQPGEGVLSLARAFHFAGTPALVMSQWPVDDLSASKIMDKFYEGIEKGLPLNKALQQAKLFYLSSSDKASSDPKYWASFQLTGYPGQIEVAADHKNNRKILIAMLVILMVIVIFSGRQYIRKRNR